jgi:UDP-glucose 4-epimerase
MSARRVLITGISTYWGARLAQALEQRDEVEAIIGVDSEDPARELERTEFVRVGTQHALLRRIVDAAAIDTVVDTRLVVDSTTRPPRQIHENNVIGTMNILAACSGTTVRRFVFKSSAHYYGAEQDDPAFFTEAMRRPHPPRTSLERDIAEAEAAVNEFAEKSREVSVTVLRFANVLGPDVRTAHTALFSLPVVPTILGFDPRYQFVHEDDVVSALEHVTERELPGVYNVAADGVLALSEVASLLGKQWAPLLPPWGTGLAANALRRVGVRIPPEMLSQLRFGRGLDNRRLKATGFEYRYTTRETVVRFGEHLRLAPVLRGVREPYRYEREVEEFLRWSPSVVSQGGGGGPIAGRRFVELEKLIDTYADSAGVGPAAEGRASEARRARARRRSQVEAGEVESAADDAAERAHRGRRRARRPPAEEYEELAPDEIVALLGSLGDADLEALREHERAGQAREPVLAAIERVLARRAAGAAR